MGKLMTPEQKNANEKKVVAAIKSLNKEGYGLKLFANDLGVSYQTIRNLISGGHHTSEARIIKLAEILESKYHYAIELETKEEE